MTNRIFLVACENEYLYSGIVAGQTKEVELTPELEEKITKELMRKIIRSNAHSRIKVQYANVIYQVFQKLRKAAEDDKT